MTKKNKGRGEPHSAASPQHVFVELEQRRRRLASELAQRQSRQRVMPVDREDRTDWIRRPGRIDPEGFDPVLKRELKTSGLQRLFKQAPIYQAWAEVVGPEIGDQTRVTGLRGGTLTVEVFNNALRQELEQFFKPSLIESLRPLLPTGTLRDIRFRAGVHEEKRRTG